MWWKLVSCLFHFFATCMQVLIQYFPIGPCPEARMRDSLLMCDDRGLFRPRQCRKVDGSRTYQCRCVEPLTGTLIRDTQVEVENLDAVPDCDDRGTNQRMTATNKIFMSHTIENTTFDSAKVGLIQSADMSISNPHMHNKYNTMSKEFFCVFFSS